jgi:hypothetical protein
MNHQLAKVFIFEKNGIYRKGTGCRIIKSITNTRGFLWLEYKKSPSLYGLCIKVVGKTGFEPPVRHTGALPNSAPF